MQVCVQECKRIEMTNAREKYVKYEKECTTIEMKNASVCKINARMC